MNTVKQKREERGLSQTELAYKAGVSQRYIAFVESGKRRPSLGVAHKIAHTLQTTVDSLFFTHNCTKSTEKEVAP